MGGQRYATTGPESLLFGGLATDINALSSFGMNRIVWSSLLPPSLLPPASCLLPPFFPIFFFFFSQLEFLMAIHFCVTSPLMPDMSSSSSCSFGGFEGRMVPLLTLLSLLPLASLGLFLGVPFKLFSL